MMMKFPVISLLLCLINLPCFADSLCDDGYFNAELGICQSGGGANYYPGQRTAKKHQPIDYYGALAADTVTGKGSGHADNFQSLQEAQAGALRACNHSGCQIIISYKNACGSMVVADTPIGSPNHVAGGVGNTPDEAEQNAFTECEHLNPGVKCLMWAEGACSYRE